ncbi:MAG: hypothetical protein V1771_02180 [Chloroflexota bacterium]
MNLKNSVKVLLGGLALVALLSVSLLGCATGSAPEPAPSPSPAPAAPVPAGKPAPAPSAPAPLTAGTKLKLTVTEPEDNIIVDTDRIEVKGTTGPGAVVSANSEFTTADSQGNFAIAVMLDEGPNIIEVFTSDESGNEANLTVTVSYVK